MSQYTAYEYEKHNSVNAIIEHNNVNAIIEHNSVNATME